MTRIFIVHANYQQTLNWFMQHKEVLEREEVTAFSVTESQPALSVSIDYIRAADEIAFVHIPSDPMQEAMIQAAAGEWQEFIVSVLGEDGRHGIVERRFESNWEGASL